MRAAALFLLLILAAPKAQSDGTIAAGPVTISMVNGHASDCLDPSGLCLASASGPSLGEMNVDPSVHFYYVSVNVDDEQLQNATGHELLSDGGLRVDSTSFVIRHPVFVVFAERVGKASGPGPLSLYAVMVNETRWGATFYGPNPSDPESGLAQRNWTHGFSDDWIGYRWITPLGTFGNTTTDDNIEFALQFPCETLEDEACEAQNAEIYDDLVAELPNVRMGLGVYELGVNDPRGAHADAMGDRPAASGIDPGRQIVLPPTSLERYSPTTARPFALAGGGPVDERTPRGPAAVGTRGAPVQPVFEGMDRPGPHPLLAACAAAALALAAIAAAFYSRHARREDALRSERRAAMLALLAERGPLTCAQMSEATGLDRTTIVHHARILVQAEALRVRRAGRHLYLALPGQSLPDERVGSSDVAVAVVRLLGERGGVMPRAEVHRALDRYPSRSRNEAIRRLVERGALERAFQGSVEVLRTTPPAAGV